MNTTKLNYKIIKLISIFIIVVVFIIIITVNIFYFENKEIYYREINYIIWKYIPLT